MIVKEGCLASEGLKVLVHLMSTISIAPKLLHSSNAQFSEN